MTIEEALKELQNADGSYCCVLPPVMDSADGVPRIKCIVCGRTVRKAGDQWMVSDWGKKGIKV